MINDLAIETYGLTKTFGLMTAVESLDLAVPRGSIYGFLGPNGAGKTTTIKLLLGLNRPTAGEARVLGYDVTRQTVDILVRVGYVPETSALYDYYKVQDILRFCRDCYPSWDQPLVDRYLELFQLPRKQKVGNLSKGMKNQLALGGGPGGQAGAVDSG
ncbi:MAG: ABC transporter ATP-binding protein [Clostridia bacterium]|nr:ABC transporter ATP-binding protein [Clostridia bacterium]